MKVLTKKNFAAFALTGLLTVTCAGFMGNGTVAESEGVSETAAVASTNEIVEMPVIAEASKDEEGNSIYYTPHNCLVSYSIMNAHGDTVNINMGRNNASNDILTYSDVRRGASVTYIAKPTNGTTCHPSLYNVSAYCPTCKKHSNVNAYMINNYNYAYDAQCVYGMKDYISSGTIPTAFDQSGNLWTHNITVGGFIYYTIAYQGIFVDDSIFSTFLMGTEQKSHVINGVTFIVRTGPKKISIKADKDIECNNYDTMFAFYYG